MALHSLFGKMAFVKAVMLLYCLCRTEQCENSQVNGTESDVALRNLESKVLGTMINYLFGRLDVRLPWRHTQAEAAE